MNASKGPLQWHAGNIETALTSWSRRNLRL